MGAVQGRARRAFPCSRLPQAARRRPTNERLTGALRAARPNKSKGAGRPRCPGQRV